jgi:hypothetical protein
MAEEQQQERGRPDDYIYYIWTELFSTTAEVSQGAARPDGDGTSHVRRLACPGSPLPGAPLSLQSPIGSQIGAGAEGFSNRSDKGLSVDFVEEGGVSL